MFITMRWQITKLNNALNLLTITIRCILINIGDVAFNSILQKKHSSLFGLCANAPNVNCDGKE